jgi:hypothetical protein
MIMRSWLLACASVVSLVLPPPASAATILITDEEAKSPPPRGAFANDQRGVTRGPKIQFVGDLNPVHSPMHLRLKFESFGGAQIDPDSVTVTYLRTPNVDLTARIRSFVEMTGIDVPDAELPVGDFMLRVDIKDSDGRSGSTSFVLQVRRDEGASR